MRRGLKTILWGIVLGGILGSAISSLLSYFLPSGWIKELFVRGVKIGISPFQAMLGFFELTFGFSFHLTLVSVIVIIIVTVLLWRMG